MTSRLSALLSAWVEIRALIECQNEKIDGLVRLTA